MIRTGRDANPGVGRPSNAGVTTINEARSKSDATPNRQALTTAARKFVAAPSAVPKARYPTAELVNDAALNSPLDSQRNFRRRALNVSGGSRTSCAGGEENL